MRRPDWLRFDLRPLGHPLWWAALVLLGANDQFLKRAHILPGWLTGKLSDFAFLIVAPVLAACLIPTAVRSRRAIALTAVGGTFAAAKLWAPLSQGLVLVLRQAGIVWRLWPDPTDLMALVVLPLAARLMRWRGASGPRLPARAGAILGALACVATSALPAYQHNPFLLNAAPGPMTVRVTWLLRDVPCPAPVPTQPVNGSLGRPNVAAELAATLTPGDLDDPIAFVLQRGQVAALDGPPPRGVSPGGVCAARPIDPLATCVGVVLDAPPAAPVLVVGRASWIEQQDGGCGDSPPPVSQCESTLDPDSNPGPDAVTLKTVSGTLQFVVASRFSAAAVDLGAIVGRAVPAGSCRQVRDDLQQLLSADQPCATDADCLAYNPPPVLGLQPACGSDVTVASVPELNRLEATWSNACVITRSASCGLPPVAVCRGGLCAPATVRDAAADHGGEGDAASDAAARGDAAGHD